MQAAPGFKIPPIVAVGLEGPGDLAAATNFFVVSISSLKAACAARSGPRVQMEEFFGRHKPPKTAPLRLFQLTDNSFAPHCKQR